MSKLIALFVLLTTFAATLAQNGARMSSLDTFPAGYWPLEKSQPIIEKTETIRLAPDLSQLSSGERDAVRKLLEVGKIFQQLYEEQRHPRALEVYRELLWLDKQTGSSPASRNLLLLYRLNQGPIATTLENKREPFAAVEAPAPGKNMYPWGITQKDLDPFLASHPDKRNELLDQRTAVKTGTAENLKADLATLRKYPVLDTLHPKLKTQLEDLVGNSPRLTPSSFYAVPYALAYADELVRAYGLLNEAADAVQKDDEEFARYLRNRARDLLTNDYESGDASWVTGHFKNLNAQIGSYETYDDELYGVKTFFAFSLLLTRQARRFSAL